ncbi:MAG TPA: glycoside hydrolase family 88 protein [Opitutaceae bacterium]|nr:glycoside hydrolase family 88 protein [Opitutaceae bacterium]
MASSRLLNGRLATTTAVFLLSIVPVPGQPAPPAGPVAARDQAAINPGRIPPNYPVPYAPASVEGITVVLTRVREYLETATPVGLVDRESGQPVTDLAKIGPTTSVERGDFLLVSYEWGVTYAGMLLAGEATGDAKFTDYTARRLKFIADVAPAFRALVATMPQLLPQPGQLPGPGTGSGQGQGPGAGPRRMPLGFSLRSVIAPRTLDDSGSMCAAMIKAHRAGVGGDLRPLIDHYMQFISSEQFRLPDGTLARNRPLPNALWLDDLFMSVPALAQMGKLTGETRYYDDAVKQILQFSQRMYVPEKGLYMHGWIQGMDPHPAFHWGRANGWAFMAMTELLEVLPADHPGRAAVLAQYRAQARSLAACQRGDGLWSQLLDRNDSYPETSASAIFVYCYARGINRGWLDPLAYGPMTSLAWNAVAKKVNDKGQVEGTCVGTGMGFDPAFYYYRPASVLAAHGYGPVLLAGAEMIALRKSKGTDASVSDGAIQLVRPVPRS